jgi:hypothetical protein
MYHRQVWSEILLHISDMSSLTSGLKSQILDRVDRGTVGAVWTPSDFLDIAGRYAVDMTLQRLVKWGNLRRIDRGLCDKPRFNSLTKQDSPADPKAVTGPSKGRKVNRDCLICGRHYPAKAEFYKMQGNGCNFNVYPAKYKSGILQGKRSCFSRFPMSKLGWSLT